MATVTPNYNWPVPTSTDFVKDGADSIKDLGDAIDATVFGLPAGALAHINTTTFSAVASQSFNDVFSATYDNYVLIMDFSSSTDVNINLRLRASGSDISTSNYSRHMQISSTGANTYVGQGATGQTSLVFATSGGTNSIKAVNVTLFRPFLTAVTSLIGTHNTSFTSGVADYKGGSVHGAYTLTTSATGFTIFPNSGNITGTVRVYGVQN